MTINLRENTNYRCFPFHVGPNFINHAVILKGTVDGVLAGSRLLRYC